MYIFRENKKRKAGQGFIIPSMLFAERWAIMMQKKKIFVSILFLSFFFFILTGCEPNPTKGGDGCGMFDLATEIKITYKEKTYKITEKKKVSKKTKTVLTIKMRYGKL